MNSLVTTLLMSLVFTPLITSAQNFQNLGGGQTSSNITAQVTPEKPLPNQFVTVTVENYSTDINRANISWFLNGKMEKEGVGEKSFLFKTGAPGSVSNILIVIKTTEGETLQHVLNIRPGALDLVWEAQSYTPPFYKGKALYPYQGTVKVVALPNIVNENGEIINSKNLVYTWSVNGGTVASVSGYGKNFIYYNGTIPINSTAISVEASSLDKKYSAGGSISLEPQAPLALFYEDSPIYGLLYNKVLGTSETLKNEEIKIVAIPYFVGVKEREGSGLLYEWRLNSNLVNSVKGLSSLTFKQENDAKGTASVSLQVSNPARMFQFANNDLSITFGQISGINLFPTQ
ncbi:MAG: hypothetical protein AAB511_01090 [Patescibacteria group bacterium]